MEFLLLIGAIAFIIYCIRSISTASAAREDIKRLEFKIARLEGIVRGEVDPQSTKENPYQQVSLPTMYGDTYIRPVSTAIPVPLALVHTSISGTPTPAVAALRTEAESSAAVVWWTSQDILTKVGAVLVLMAVGWFVSIIILAGVIGPVGQISIGTMLGLTFLGFGLSRMEKNAAQGGIFVALGAAIVLLVVFAGRYAYDFFTPVSATLVMLGAVATTAYASVRHNREPLAVAALSMAGIVPVLAHSASADTFQLFAYILIISVGAFVVAATMGSRILLPLTLGLVFLWGLPYIDAIELDRLVAFGFSSLFAFLFTVANILSLIKESRADYSSYTVTALGTGFYVSLWVLGAAPEIWQVPVLMTWIIFFTGSAYLIHVAHKDPLIGRVYLAIAVMFVAIVTNKLFDGPVLVVMAMAEVTTLVLVLLKLSPSTLTARMASFLYGIPILLSVEELISPAWRNGVLHPACLVLVAMTMIFFFIAYQFHLHDDTEEELPMAAVATIVGFFYSLALIWLVLHAAIGDGIATALALIVYTVIGLTLYVGGVRTGDEFAKKLGLLTVGGVIARLLFVEIWHLPVELRMMAFFVIGIMLLSTAFITKRK